MRLDTASLSTYKWLTREDQIPWDKIECHLAKYKETESFGQGNPYIGDHEADKFSKWLDKLIMNSNISNDLKEFECKARDKWYGPQGGIPSLEQLSEAIEKYYTRLPDSSFKLHMPSAHVLAELFGEAKNETVDIITFEKLWFKYSGDHKSNSGVTTWSDRREYSTRQKAMKIGYKIYKKLRSLQLVVLGSRRQRNKPARCIFMDSFANYFAEVAAFSFTEYLWKDSNCVAWRGDAYVEKYIKDFYAQFKRVVHFESDFEAMDTWVVLLHFKHFLAICHENKYISDELYKYALWLSQELFNVPLVTPFGVLEGEHSLLSGIYPTNPMESPLNLMINLHWIDTELSPKLELNKDFIIIVLGDDVLILFNQDKLEELGINYQTFPKSFSDFAWREYHINAEVSKQRVSLTSGFFCKRQFPRRGKGKDYPSLGFSTTESIRPLWLIWLSIRYPEDGMDPSKAINLIALWARLDGGHGHPLWRPFVEGVWRLVHSQYESIAITDDDIAAYNSDPKKRSWRIMVYGEPYSIANSPSAQLWQELDLNVR
jgi:hypothetical protein